MSNLEKKGLDFFGMNVDMWDNNKILCIIADAGPNSVGVLTRLLCEIYRSGYGCKWNDRQLKIFTQKTGFDRDLIEITVKAALDEGFFHKKTFQRFGFLTSAEIQARFALGTLRRKKPKIDAEHLLLDPIPAHILVVNHPIEISETNCDVDINSRQLGNCKHDVNISQAELEECIHNVDTNRAEPQECIHDVDISRQSKVKESKDKESKLKERKERDLDNITRARDDHEPEPDELTLSEIEILKITNNACHGDAQAFEQHKRECELYLKSHGWRSASGQRIKNHSAYLERWILRSGSYGAREGPLKRNRKNKMTELLEQIANCEEVDDDIFGN